MKHQHWAELLAVSHPEEDLSPSEYTALKEHLACCPECAAIRQQYLLMTARIRALPGVKPLPNLTPQLSQSDEDMAAHEEQTDLISSSALPHQKYTEGHSRKNTLRDAIGTGQAALVVMMIMFVALVLFQRNSLVFIAAVIRWIYSYFMGIPLSASLSFISLTVTVIGLITIYRSMTKSERKVIPGNHPSPRLALFFTFFVILVVCTQIFSGFIYNASSTSPVPILLNGLIALSTLVLALFQIFPKGILVFSGSLHIPGLTTFLRKRRASFIMLSLILIISLSFNIYLILPKTRTDTESGTSTVTPIATPFAVSPSTGSLREFLVPTPDSRPVAMVRGSDGNLWFTEEQGNKIGRITPQGQITEFLVPTPNSILGGLTRGSDGNLWFYENKGNKVGRITPQGQITEFPLPAESDLVGITAGPDGNVWFVGYKPNKIWRMATSGTITGEFTIPTEGSGTETIIAGPDGNVWFVEDWGNKIGRITPQGQITEFAIPTPLVPGQQNYHNAVAGPDGNIWFTEGLANKIGRITPQGQITEFPLPLLGGNPSSLYTGPNGTIWFTDDTNHIGQITPSGTFLDEFAIPALENRPLALTVGQDRIMWFIEPLANKIGRITLAFGQP